MQMIPLSCRAAGRNRRWSDLEDLNVDEGFAVRGARRRA